uniref:Ankyrin repeat domain-containing protein 40 n=1 Tax=Mus spicilegus TaxID=10103 RepID=A0A8C6N4J5_MUSSI
MNFNCNTYQKEQLERLQETEALGDIGEVQKLVESRVDVNSQNEVNGWTCLHWAYKHNRGQVVSYLLQSGTDRDSYNKRRNAGTVNIKERNQENAPFFFFFFFNYLANPAFPFISTPATEDSTQLQNGGPSPPPVSPPADGSPPLLPTTEPPLLGAFPRDHSSLALVQNGDISAPSVILRTPESTKPGPLCQPPVGQNCSLFTVPPKPPGVSGASEWVYVGPALAFQPFFFTRAFPFNMQELVLKVRIQNPSLRENDFIKLNWIDRNSPRPKVNQHSVKKGKRLGGGGRKDKDVARLQDFQELELVLMISKNNFLFRKAASTLTESTCYNQSFKTDILILTYL